MTRKYTVATCIILTVTLLAVAMIIYPGGTYQNKNTVGFGFANNYISSLFETTALNGSPNPSRLWACVGMFFYAAGCAVFFWNMAKKIPDKNAANIIKYAGLLTLPFTFFIITTLHDVMLTVSSILFWTCIMTITVFVLKSRLHILKAYCVLCLLIFYYAVYIHVSADWSWLALVQKINVISSIVLILWLEYFTGKEDFAHIRSGKAIK